MIQSRQDYRDYLEADRRSLGRHALPPLFFIQDPIWFFERLLRKTEYYNNCRKTGLWKLYFYFLRFRLKKSSIRLSFAIPLNVIGPGLFIVHYGSIIISCRARIGSNVRINAGVVIGENKAAENVPIIGNNVIIGAGAKVFGKIVIADGIHIGANAVVNKSFPEPNVVVAGVPARVIGKRG